MRETMPYRLGQLWAYPGAQRRPSAAMPPGSALSAACPHLLEAQCGIRVQLVVVDAAFNLVDPPSFQSRCRSSLALEPAPSRKQVLAQKADGQSCTAESSNSEFLFVLLT